MDGTCKFNASNVGATIKSWTDVASGSEPDLQKVVMMMMMRIIMMMIMMMVMIMIMGRMVWIATIKSWTNVASGSEPDLQKVAVNNPFNILNIELFCYFIVSL